MSRGLPTDTKQQLVTDYRRHDNDTGSTDVQVAVLQTRIKNLTEHLKSNKKDHHTRLGLLKLVSRQRRLLKHLKREDFDRYKELTQRLGIRT